MGASTPLGMKEEGGSSCGPVLAMGASLRPGTLGRAPGWGSALGTKAAWGFSRKGLVWEGSAGWARPRSCSLNVSGLSRGKAGWSGLSILLTHPHPQTPNHMPWMEVLCTLGLKIHDLPLPPEAATLQGPLALQGLQQEVGTSWLLPRAADGTAGKKQGLFLGLPRGRGV